MPNREAPTPFVIVGATPGGALAIPVSSARAAAQAARHLTHYCPHTRATWQVNPQAGPGPVAVFGRARPRTDEHLPDQDTHAFLLVPGDPLPSVWVTMCGHLIGNLEFEVLDQGMGQPCRDCHQRWTTPHHRHPSLPVRSPGEHLHPQLRRPPGQLL
ncbi:MAG: hypothetical protein ACRDTH_05035 [Pseudonocardiaceae bacterium]